MDYPKPRRPVLHLQSLSRKSNYSEILSEPRTPKIAYPHFSEVEFIYDPGSEGQHVRLRQDGHVKTAVIVSYILIIAGVIASLVTIIALMMTRQDKSSTMFPQSFPVFKTSCDSRRLQFNNLFAHLFVNTIGTMILGLSNYIQQMCASPTIEEVSDGFRKHGDVVFGSNSASAVFRLGQRTLSAAWIGLMVTSLPLHITLNGITGFAAKSVLADRLALTPSQINLLSPTWLSWNNVTAEGCANLLVSSRAHVTNFDNITILIKDGLPDDAVSYYNGSGESYYAQASDIINCYVNMIPSECQLSVRWFPLLFTSIAIIAKATIVSVLIRCHSHFQIPQFSTLGDMIVLGARHPELRQFLSDDVTPRGAIFEGPYCRQKLPWRRALGVSDFVVACFWWTTAIAVTTLGTYSWYNVVGGLNLSMRLKRFGLGTEDPATSIVSGSLGRPFHQGVPFALQVIIANLPQVWSTICYLTWNNQITRIWLELEWRSYYRAHIRPQVSINSKEPGVQNARWLQLPYWLTGVLMSISVLLHWLVSQTLFVVEIYFTDSVIASVFHLHYSPLAIILVGTIATTLAFGLTVYYFVPITTWMPLMAGSTKVVFDSCFRLPSDGLPRTGIGWGDISVGNDRVAGFGTVVAKMVEGVKYPGLISEEIQPSLFDYPYITDFDTEPLVRRHREG